MTHGLPLESLTKNGLGEDLVYIGVVLSLNNGDPTAPMEAALAHGRHTDAAERVLDLADGGLDRAFRLAGLILGDQHEAEDATQDALLRAWQSAASLREPAGFSAWFDRILINVCRDRLRRRGRVRLIAIDPGLAALPSRDPFREIADRDQILTAMIALEDDERIVILLHYWADLTLEAVAERVGWPVGTVKSRLHRALESMRQRVDGPATGGPSR